MKQPPLKNNVFFRIALLVKALIILICFTSCDPKVAENNVESQHVDLTTLEQEIALKLSEFENYLQNGDSVALGKMYLENAVIMPSTIGRASIVRNFGSMIRDSITGSSFETTDLWGDNQLLVEQGIGTWYYQNGQEAGHGKYLVVWQKEQGDWKILRDIWFPDKKK